MSLRSSAGTPKAPISAIFFVHIRSGYCLILQTGCVVVNGYEQKGPDMNETIVKPAGPQEPAEAQKQQPEVESFDLFIKQIENRACTQTQVLLGVLERDEAARWRHWGINE